MFIRLLKMNPLKVNIEIDNINAMYTKVMTSINITRYLSVVTNFELK